jgi:predicted Zn-dependent protease
VLGAVEAHELGHVLGLKHARGVMRARLDANDILALRLGILVFRASQSARMRALLAKPAGEELARGREP